MKDIEEAPPQIHEGRNKWAEHHLKNKIVVFDHPEHGRQKGRITRFRFLGYVNYAIPEFKVRIKGLKGKFVDVNLVQANCSLCQTWEEAKLKIKGKFQPKTKEIKNDEEWK